MPKRLSQVLLVLGLLLFGLFFLNLSLGSEVVPIGELAAALFSGEASEEIWTTIVWQWRLPKALTAILVGIGLSTSGLQMQTLFRNPLAGPFVLGISAGASLGVALLVFVFHFLQWPFANIWLHSLAASLGAGAVLLLVLLASTRVQDYTILLILGLMFGSATGALVSILQYFSTAEQVQSFVIWTMGDLGELHWPELGILASCVFLALILSIAYLKPLNALLLGEDYARSLGLHLKRTRIGIIFITSLLAGSITAFCGPIAFVGIAMPHLARLITHQANHFVLLPVTCLLGACFMLLADTIAQVPYSSYILPINAITALLGSPLVIFFIWARKI